MTRDVGFPNQFPYPGPWVKRLAGFFKTAVLLVFISTKSLAQTFPPASSCTSKDLELLSATLPPPANDRCQCEGTRTLMLGIINKTGSTRTSFALWGTLLTFNAAGDTISQEAIVACAGPIPKNATSVLASDKQITVSCGQSFKIVNLYLAWTSASPGETCAVLKANPSTINPKCGILPEINVGLGVAATITKTNATCTAGGSIKVEPSGGIGPYQVCLYKKTSATDSTLIDVCRNVVANGSTTFSGLATGDYTIRTTDNMSETDVTKRCFTNRMTTITQPDQVAAPSATVGQPTCTTATGSVSVNSFDNTITYTLKQGGVLKYTANGSGVFIAVASGIYDLIATKGSCSASGSITVNAQPATPDAPAASGDEQCEQNPLQTLTATATAPSGGSIVWYDAATGGIAVSPTLSAVGTKTYYAEASNGTCSSLSRTAVILTINAAPAAPTSGGNQTVCETSPIQTLTATASGGTITWYEAATGGSAVSPTLSAVGTKTYYAEASNGTCSSLTRTAVTLTINAAPAAPTSGGNQTVCETSPIQTLTATASGGTITWYEAATGGSAVSPTLSAVGTKTYYAEASNGTCSSLTRTAVTLTINAAPAAPTSGGNQTVCETSPIQTLTATASGGTITWYEAATGGSAVSPTLSAVGTKTYYAEASNGTCSSLTRTAVILTINAAPAAPTSGGNQTVCETSPIQTLTATASGGTITWYEAATGGSAVSPTLSAVGTKTYYAEASNGTCSSLTRTAVTLTINATPAAPTAEVTQPTCGTPTGTISVTSGISGLSFSINSTDPSAFTNSTGAFSGLAAGDYAIRAKNASGCISAPVSKTVNAAASVPPTPVVGVKQAASCSSSSIILEVSSPLGSDFLYSNNNGDWQASTEFTIKAGDGYNIKARRISDNTCISEAAGCGAETTTSNRSQQPVSTTTTKMVTTVITQTESGGTGVKAFPNPYNDKVKLVVTSPVAGNGSLEVINMLGQKIKTVYQGRIIAGNQAFDVNIPAAQRSTLIYIFRMGGRQITGKLLQLNQ
ncbi:hypothetical protein [Terrimonas pollutisoli]|uniref:Ig-like domain-containing protein n=1 Tax=Terrimonas pollutisoli TaxID=3034147 RepID=UPI0023EC7A44|nr:hypothetical protein [Terrimonas sp. H1YJ31]